MSKKKKSNRSKYRSITALICAVWMFLSVDQVLAATTTVDISGFSYAGTDLKAAYTVDDSYTGQVSFSAGSGSIEVIVNDYESSKTSGGCNSSQTTTYTYAKVSSTLRIWNNSDTDALVIYYSITEAGDNQGSCSLEPNKRRNVTLAPKGEISITFDSGVRTSEDGNRNTTAEPAKYTVTIDSAEAVKNDIKVTLAEVPAIDTISPGSYTAAVGETSYTIGETYDATISTEFTFKATANEGYLFDGWYVNGSRVSTENPFTSNFYEENVTVSARFNLADPLAQIAILNVEDSEGETIDYALTKYDFLTFNSASTHGTQHSYHTTYGTDGTNNDYGDPYYFEDPVWTLNGTAIGSSARGTATGDTQTSAGYSNAQAFMYSDVITVQAKEDCRVSFDCDLTASGSSFKTAYLCYLISSSATAPTIKVSATDENYTATKLNNSSIVVVCGGSDKSSDSVSATVPLSQGQYLHIYTLGYSVKHEFKWSGHSENSYSYSASISNFRITDLNTRYEVSTSFADNTDQALGSGKVTVNGTDYAISSNGTVAQNYSAVAGTQITMSIKQTPSNYVFFGWLDETTGDRIYAPTYSYTLNGTHEIKALFVPIVTITMGNSGYGDATYVYKNLAGNTVSLEGQYVARNAGYTAFYTNLKDAFEVENTVVLLAGDTLKGDFEIPTGKTLVIPYGMEDAGSTTPVQLTASKSMTSYCAATLDGQLTVNGTLVVSAQQDGYSYGRPGGPIGILKLSDSAGITVNGTLCAFGLISGNGIITANTDSVVYEFMEVRDMRSILVVYEIYKQDSYQTFPFSNFFIKNIEAAVTYNKGAELKALFSLKLAGNDESSTGEIPLIGSSRSMFNISLGSVTKKYNRATDQTIYRVNGDSEAYTGTFSISMTYASGGMSQNISLNTKDYYLPLCAGYGIEVAGSLTMNDKFKLLPGASLSVTEEGEMTVAGGAELIVYRLNDYDLRSRGSEMTYQGYCTGGYPVNSSTYPTSTYSRRSKATIGSAKVHVDGALNVLGGLYVTDDDLELTTYSNGYNVLTGTGTVNMANAASDTSAIYEAMSCSGANEVEFDEVRLSSIKGLPVTAGEDAPGNYNALEEDIYYGVQKGDFYVWCTNRMQFFEGDTLQYVAASSSANDPVAEGLITNGNGTVLQTLDDPAADDRVSMGWKIEDGKPEHAENILKNTFDSYAEDAKLYAVYAVAQIEDIPYETLAKAVSECSSGHYIQMLENTKEAVMLEQDVMIDLNGKSVIITDVPEKAVTIYGADAQTNGYGLGDTPLASGSLTISGTNVTVAPVSYVNKRNYVTYFSTDENGKAVTDDSGSITYSFHRFEITPIGYQFYYNPNGTHPSHLAFQAAIQGDETARRMVKDIGFCIEASETPDEGTSASVENWYLVDVNSNKPQGEEVELSMPANEELITFVAVEFADESDFGVVYTVTAKADFDGTYQNALIKSDSTHQISFDAALNAYYEYLTALEELDSTQMNAKTIIGKYRGAGD